VADAGPLIALGWAGRLRLLREVLGKVLVPDAVVRECLRNRTLPGAEAVRQALNDGLLSRGQVRDVAKTREHARDKRWTLRLQMLTVRQSAKSVSPASKMSGP
jgi:hypothetical protein